MRRNLLNFIVDAVSLIAMAGLVATGLIVKYVLPAGSGGHGRGGGLKVWGWSRHDWGDLHFYIAVGILVLMVVHVALHWRWICAVARNWFVAAPGGPHRTARIMAGLAFVVLLCGGTGGFVWIAAENVEGDMPPGHGRNRTLAHEENCAGRNNGEFTNCETRGGACERGARSGRGAGSDGNQHGERRRMRGRRGWENGGGRGRRNAVEPSAATASQP